MTRNFSEFFENIPHNIIIYLWSRKKIINTTLHLFHMYFTTLTLRLYMTLHVRQYSVIEYNWEKLLQKKETACIVLQ